MKKILLLTVLLATPLINQAAVVNKVVVSVGRMAITTYDIDRMRAFESEISPKKPSTTEALRKLINMSSLLVIAEDSPEYYMDEAELRKHINAMTNNPSDPNVEQRKALYEKYSDLYRMVIRSDKVKRGLSMTDPQVKVTVGQPISEKESFAFYKKNKKQFVDSPFPKFNLIIFAIESSPRWSLSELSEVEGKMAQLAVDLDTSSDYNALRKKYSSLRFTSYSGATGLFAPDVLILQKKIPDEILGIALEKNLNLGATSIPIKKNKGIFIPQPIPFRNTGKPTYLTMKILDVVQPIQLSYEEALVYIEERIRSDKAAKAVDDLIKQRIKDGQITLTPAEGSHDALFKEFNQ